ncbi:MULTISPECIES: AAA family ATPase [Xanthomonas]|uniref:ATPases of the AAA+ class n=1 Tax=Xanthomonas campestris pv. campestris (strain 8004) TaxID=314565 RepID=A0A0H2X8D6_XANC8|nr:MULTISPECIES: ATP-binding protein [Xanthomonas]AAY49483.1 ATPases of the AAA+ class [Xanthomonas campestris pv. campestris str. 8004]MBD8246540.1 AAA family ATPase [Xanthomonas campestris]NJB91821.1 AAA+ superfamily predicted ATPase [Xanthomonas arboricola]QCX68023.1 ATPase [Xanthomonas campestris pv. campestris]QCX71480.1 ATPase [Xanthomonas campestris pv. campestris]
MSQTGVFDAKIVLTDPKLSAREKTLLGFEARFSKIHRQLRLLLNLGQLDVWSKTHHKAKLPLCELVAEQYPLVIFHGDVGTGKTATAECVANRLAKESKTEDAQLFRLSNRVRGGGKVGEMGTLLTQAFHEVVQSAGKNRRAFLIIDEGDSIAASRNQDHSHHEDKVAVNTLIQGVDDLRSHGGRVVVFLCTNRLSVLDAALRRRAAVVEMFTRPNDAERRELLNMDLSGLGLAPKQIEQLVMTTGPQGQQPGWTFSDIRTRLYPAALAQAFPDRALSFEDFYSAASALRPSPIMEDK